LPWGRQIGKETVIFGERKGQLHLKRAVLGDVITA